jgi:hypothetical protein
VLAVAALAVPVAHAGPLQEPSSAVNARDQDLRHLPGPPTWPAHPQPITPARAVENPNADGVDWTMIALGVAGACLVAGGAAAIATRTRRRTARTRVAA